MIPETLLGMGRNFMESRVLLTAAELDVFSALRDRPLTAREAAERLGVTRRGITVLLDALASMCLVEKREGVYSCPDAVAPLLAKDSPESILPMVLHAAGLWRRWSDLTEIVRSGREGAGPAATRSEGEQEAFIGAMHAVACRVAPGIIAAIGPGAAGRLLDIGGASGSYTQAFLEASHSLRATLFDLPPVIEMARRRLAGTGVFDRVTFIAGDFYRDGLPEGYDLALLSAIIHQNSPAQNLDLYKKIHLSLQKGGRLVIRDHVMSPDHTRPAAGALFAVNMLVGTAGGGTYDFDEIREGLEAAGFGRVRLMQADERMNGLVEAFKE
ncbi:MAG: MarR family transcriptional regulator [Spirochaetes bacterium]|nr:MarR family transcriptional regulator [Spirochaetota bacterium]